MYSEESEELESEITCSHADSILKYCDSCDQLGCNKCIKVVCSDCCLVMCTNCTYNDDILCGCYGTCYNCETDVNRGEHGWPCSTCNRWFCSKECHRQNNCRDCEDSEEESEEKSEQGSEEKSEEDNEDK